MTYDQLYKPEPCSAWRVHELQALAAAHREAGGRGLDGPACLEAAVAAYLAAGGGQHGAERAVRDMIASLSREQDDWLWGSAQAWRDRHAPTIQEPAWAKTEGAQ